MALWQLTSTTWRPVCSLPWGFDAQAVHAPARKLGISKVTSTLKWASFLWANSLPFPLLLRAQPLVAVFLQESADALLQFD